MKRHTENLCKKIKSYEYKVRNRKSAKDFTRDSKVGFVKYVMLILNYMKKSVQIELNKFFKHVIGASIGLKRQSFEDAREKILDSAFTEILELSVENALDLEDADYYKNGSMKSSSGYRVSVIDGTTVRLENSGELRREYGESTPCEGQIYARVSMVYDVLNDFISDADIQPFSVGERKMAMAHIDKLLSKDKQRNLFVMDRGYWSPAAGREHLLLA